MVAVHIILQVDSHRAQEEIQRLVNQHLSKLVVYLLNLTHDTVEWYHITGSTCGDKVGTNNLNIGERYNLVTVCSEAEDKVTLPHGVVASLLRGNLEITLN